MKQPTQLWFTALLLGLVACAAYQAGPSATRSAAASSAPVSKEWRNVKDPMGFSVQVPQGWNAQGDRMSGRVRLSGPAGEQIVIWPVFFSAPLNQQAAASVLQTLAPKFWPSARWERPQTISPTALRARGQVNDRVALASLTWATSPKGSAGYLYALSAPVDTYRSMEETYARILKSFQATGAVPDSGAKAGPAVTYVRWQDPRENAFNLEAPAQWRVTGGLFRRAAVDVRTAWTMVSPDGQIQITGGDAEIPTFTVPNPMLAYAGFTEGRWYSPGYGVQMLVRRYVPGTQFAKEYVVQKVARGCSELMFSEVRDRADAVQALNAIYAQYGLPATIRAGEAAFTCRKGGQSLNGYYFAGTQLTQTSGSGLWTAEYLGGFLAPNHRVAEAQAVFARVMGSIRLNPQWVNMQQNITANTSTIVSRTHEEVSRIINNSYWNRQHSLDEISRRRSNATLGVVDVIDPVSGRELKVESGSNYYWIDHRGTMIGTQTDTRPNIDFREMIRLP